MTPGLPRPARVAALAIGLLTLASIGPANADHQVYPPGWNSPATATATVLYQFVPGGSRMHRMPPGTTAPASAAIPASGQTAADQSQPR